MKKKFGFHAHLVKNTLTHITLFNTNSDVRLARLLPLVRSFIAQEVFSGLVLLLFVHFDVTLRCCYLRVANELLSLDYVFAIIVELGCLRCPEIVAFNFYIMILIEVRDHLSPLVSWITPFSRRKHDGRVRSAQMNLVCFDDVDCLLINHDSASGRLLGNKVKLDVAIFVSFLLCN